MDRPVALKKCDQFVLWDWNWKCAIPQIFPVFQDVRCTHTCTCEIPVLQWTCQHAAKLVDNQLILNKGWSCMPRHLVMNDQQGTLKSENPHPKTLTSQGVPKFRIFPNNLFFWEYIFWKGQSVCVCVRMVKLKVIYIPIRYMYKQKSYIFILAQENLLLQHFSSNPLTRRVMLLFDEAINYCRTAADHITTMEQNPKRYHQTESAEEVPAFK